MVTYTSAHASSDANTNRLLTDRDYYYSNIAHFRVATSLSSTHQAVYLLAELIHGVSAFATGSTIRHSTTLTGNMAKNMASTLDEVGLV